jgi:hypothetical protein
VVLKAILEILVLAGTREKLVRKAILDHVELRVTKAIQVPLASTEHKASKAKLENKGHVELRVTREILANLV